MAGARNIQASIAKVQAQIHREFVTACRMVLSKRIMEVTKAACSLQDHTLAQLAAMDNPYALRHGWKDVPHDDRLIHRQGGDLLASFKDSVTDEKDKVLYVLRNTAEHWPYLKAGTKSMRARRVHDLINRGFKSEIWPDFQKALKQAFLKAGRDAK